MRMEGQADGLGSPLLCCALMNNRPAFTSSSLDEAVALDLRPGVLDKFLFENANNLFFGKDG